MASSNTDSPGTIYRWIERKPLTEAVSWTSREKFWLITAACHYGTHDWKSVAQVVRNAGEPYRPREWYTPKSCERQFKILVSNLSKEVKSLPLIDMLQHIAEGLKSDYLRDAIKSKDSLKSKYCSLFSVLNRVKQGNLSRNEVVSLYSQARRNEIEGKQYMDQLMTRQNASLASENSSSGLIEEQPIKWNTPSAPLLTSLLRSRNTIPANRTATTIASLLQSPGGTSRTRSGKLLPLTPSISRTTQGTPTLSKLLEAPANPYIPSPPQSTQKNKLSDVGTEKLANTSKKENSQSTSLNRVRVDTFTTLGSFNQINKSDLSASKRQISKSPVSAVKNGSKGNSSVVSLLSDSEPDDDTKNTSLKSLYGDKKDSSSRLEPRATRSQTRAEGGFKQLNDTKPSDGKKERENLKQQSGGSQMNETHLIDEELIDIDQIEVEPFSSVQDELQTPSKMTRSSLQKLRLLSPGDNLLTNNKINSKEISNKMLEERSANFVLNSPARTLAPEYKCLLGKPNNSDSAECLIPVDRSACKDAIMIRKDSQTLTNTLTTLKQKGVIEIKAANIRRIDSRNDSKFLSYNNQPIVVVNKIKKPFNIKLASEQRNKTDNIQVPNTDMKKPIRLNNSSQNVVKLIDSSCSLADDDVIIIDDDVNINDDNMTSVTNSAINETNNRFIKELDFDFDQSISQTSLSELYNGVEEIVEMHSFDNEELNSLIECGSLDSNETEERIDIVGADQGDSSVSESDSTIGAFDTFAQITRVRQKSFTSKNIKLDSKESKTTNQRVKHLKENFCHSVEIDDDQSSAVSVTGIPVLQGVISDVMSQIDLDCVASLKTINPHNVPITDVVEISSDEEVTVDVPIVHPLNVQQIQNKEKEVKSYKLKEDKLIKIHEIENNMYEGVNINHGTNTTINPINIEMPPCIIVNHTPDANILTCEKILEIKKEMAQEYDDHDFEMMTFIPNTDNLLIENESQEAEVIIPKEITVTIANEKLLIEAERMKKEVEERKKMEDERKKHEENERKKKEEKMRKEDEEKKKKEEDRRKREHEKMLLNELYIKKKREEEERKCKEDYERKKKEDERKKKEDERKKKEDERKKKEDVERMRKEDEEKKKKEEDRRKREHEKMLLNELYIKKKREEEERKCKEDYERKKKEDERKLKELQEKIKMEEEQKRQEKNNEEERAKNFDSAMKNFKILCVPLVSYATRTAQLKKLLEEQSAELKEQQQIQPTPNQIQKQTVTSTELEKPPPKKRGRKRLIDIQNDKLQESKRSNKNNQKRVMKYVYGNLCENKYISTLNKEVRGLSPESTVIIKSPVELQHIKRKISSGDIRLITELQIHFLMLSYNALMVNRSDSIVYSDAVQYQCELEEDCGKLRDAINEEDIIKDYSCFDMKFPDERNDLTNEPLHVNEKTIADVLHRYIDNSSPENSDSEFDSDKSPPKKKKKKK